MEKFTEGLQVLLAMVAIAQLLTMVAMGVDLLFGWRKAKERGDAHTSYAFSRSITKFALYEGVLVIGACIDIIVHFAWPMFLSTIYYVPCVTFSLSVILCAVEIWSMREKADQKTRNRVNDVTMLLINAVGKENLARAVEELIMKSKNNDEGKRDTEI